MGTPRPLSNSNSIWACILYLLNRPFFLSLCLKCQHISIQEISHIYAIFSNRCIFILKQNKESACVFLDAWRNNLPPCTRMNILTISWLIVTFNIKLLGLSKENFDLFYALSSLNIWVLTKEPTTLLMQNNLYFNAPLALLVTIVNI